MKASSSSSTFIYYLPHSNTLNINQKPGLPTERRLRYPGPQTQPLISTTSLKGKVTPTIPQKAQKSSGISFKKLFFAAAAALGAGAAIYVYNRSAANHHLACDTYYGTSAPNYGTFFGDLGSILHDVKNTLTEPLDRALCGTESAGRILRPQFAEGGSLRAVRNLSKLNLKLRNDKNFVKSLIDIKCFDIIDSLGEDLINDPQKLLSVLVHAYWESRHDVQNGTAFYGDRATLFNKIPYQSNETFCLGPKGNDEKYSEGVAAIYPKQDLSSFYESLSPELKIDPNVLITLFSRAALPDVYNSLPQSLKNNEDIVAAHIQHVDEESFKQICTQFQNSSTVAFGAYRRDYKKYESTWRLFFNNETQKSEALKSNVEKLKCATSDRICDWDYDKTRVERFQNLTAALK